MVQRLEFSNLRETFSLPFDLWAKRRGKHLVKHAQRAACGIYRRETAIALSVSTIGDCVSMARHRGRLVFGLVALLLTSPFFSDPLFSERSQHRGQPLRDVTPAESSSESPTSLPASQFQLPRAQQLLLTPTFAIHLFWIVGLLLLTVIVFFDVVFKLVFVTCTLAVPGAPPLSFAQSTLHK